MEQRKQIQEIFGLLGKKHDDNRLPSKSEENELNSTNKSLEKTKIFHSNRRSISEFQDNPSDSVTSTKPSTALTTSTVPVSVSTLKITTNSG